MATATYGGYEYSFVDKDLEKFTCNICIKVLKDPHLTGCCGQHFCESCLNYWFTKHGKESCPHCRAEAGKKFQHFLNKKLKREFDSLRIHCTNKEEGCRWIGEVGSLKDHLESAIGCGYAEVKCPNRCRRKMKRKNLANHLENKCSLRPYQCKYCGFRDTYENITGLYSGKTEYHYKQCPEFLLECPNQCGVKDIKRKNMSHHCTKCPKEPVRCPFEEAGCKEKLVRCELEQHMSATQQQHRQIIKELKMETVRLKKHNMELKQATDATSDVNSILNEELFVTKQEISTLQEGVSRAWVENSKLQQEKSAAQQENLTLRRKNYRTEQDNSRLAERNSMLEREAQLTKQKLDEMPVMLTIIPITLISLGVMYYLKHNKYI